MNRIVVAIDPGTGSAESGSACGVAIYNKNTDTLLTAFELRANSKTPAYKRILEISHQLRDVLASAKAKYGPLEVRTESFVMRGKGGETLARLVGALIASLPSDCTFAEVHNITLKKDLTGFGGADKGDIGLALVKRFPKQVDAVQRLIDTKQEDALDAIAIAICREVM